MVQYPLQTTQLGDDLAEDLRLARSKQKFEFLLSDQTAGFISIRFAQGETIFLHNSCHVT